MNRREVIKSISGAIATALIIPDTLKAENHLNGFQPLYVRMSEDKSSFLYNLSSALYREPKNSHSSIRQYYGCFIDKQGNKYFFWHPYNWENVSISGYLPHSITPEKLRLNESIYQSKGFTVAEMPTEVLQCHNRILSNNS